jgi:hypothetical protein
MAAGFHYPDIYAVKENSEFKRRLPPAESDPEKWEDAAHVIGTSANNWSAYKFLFKAPDGDLCAVKTDGYFYRASIGISHGTPQVTVSSSASVDGVHILWSQWRLVCCRTEWGFTHGSSSFTSPG